MPCIWNSNPLAPNPAVATIPHYPCCNNTLSVLVHILGMIEIVENGFGLSNYSSNRVPRCVKAVAFFWEASDLRGIHLRDSGRNVEGHCTGMH